MTDAPKDTVQERCLTCLFSLDACKCGTSDAQPAAPTGEPDEDKLIKQWDGVLQKLANTAPAPTGEGSIMGMRIRTEPTMPDNEILLVSGKSAVKITNLAPTGEEMRREAEAFYWDWVRVEGNSRPQWINSAQFERALKFAVDYAAYQAGAEGQGGKK